MNRFRGDMTERTLKVALEVVQLVRRMPSSIEGREIARQVLRSGTSIGANIREADAALTDKEFVHRCSIARKEAHETAYWLTLIERGEIILPQDIQQLRDDVDEIVSILTTIVRKMHNRWSEKESPKNDLSTC